MSKINEYQNIFSQQFLYSEENLWDLLQTLLSEKRFKHVQGVFLKALELSKILSLDLLTIEQIKKAVLFHDLAKGMNDEELFTFAQANNIDLRGVLPPIYHAIVGRWLAQEKFSLDDAEVLEAIEFHTTGCEQFLDNIVGAILFIADYTEPNRKRPTEHLILCLSKDLKVILLEIIKEKICSVVQRNRTLDMQSIAFYHVLLKTEFK